MSMQEGQTVRLVQPEIKGPIKDTRYDKTNKCLEHLVEYTDADGTAHERWFAETQLEVVEE